MTSSQAQPIQWSEYKYKKIESQLEGFWANDVWRPSENPLLGGKKSKGLVSIYFNRCVSAPLRTELKYACYIKVSRKEWGVTTLHGDDVNTLVEAIGAVAPNIESLSEYNQDVWKMYLRTYLIEQGKWQTDVLSCINLDGQKVTYSQEDHRISCFTQFYKIIQDAYDDRDKYEKDVWVSRDFGKKENGRNSSPLRFTEIQQLWYKEAAKKFIKYSLSIRTWSSCYGRLDAVKKFAEFTAKKYPLIQPFEINRQVMLDYYGYLSSFSISKSFYRSSISYLRIFLQHCNREGWLDIPDKEIIYNDDLPKVGKSQPRYIPDDVLKQLNQHIDLLPSWAMRMVLIIQECGMRISELCSLPFSCFSQDASGDFFLKYYQFKMKKEHTIPISKEVASVICEQQEETKDTWGNNCKYLFPSPRFKAKCIPTSEGSLGQVLNQLAYEKNIYDLSGKLWHFQSHQFRHTVGTQMINNGVPQHIVQRYLGHETPNMTAVYAYIFDNTLKTEFAKFKDRMVNVTGKIVSYESVATEMAEGSDPNSIDTQWLKKNIRAQALPNGLCALPVNQSECPYGANKCVAGSDGKGCPHFKTDIRYLDKHKEHLARNNEIVEWAQENPDSRRSQEVFKLNLPVKQNLERIVTTLESQQNEQ